MRKGQVKLAATAKFGRVEDTYACWAGTLNGLIEICGYTDGDPDLHVSFLVPDDKAEELAHMILERVKTRREIREGHKS